MAQLPTAPPARSASGGCLKGCLIVLALLLLPVVLVSAYSAWFFWQGFRHDPVLVAVSELVRHDGMAQAALGENIQITGVQGDLLSFMPGLGAHSDYVVGLKGAKAAGTLAIDADMAQGRVHINSMILTGPGGDRYDLMHHTMSPSAAPATSI